MKKNFFKKLSFVLASAMVLTTLAPASGAFAAKAPKLNASSKYLHLGRDDANEYNFNIKNKKSGWKYEWTSANEDVVEVNAKNGVAKAAGVGATKVAVVITDKDGEEVDELTAKVTVRDNIETVTITNLPEGTLAVGAENNFNRDFVTEAGSTKKTSGITRWTVEPSETATIKDNGIFVASEAGEYTVTAYSFQSKSKYNSWLTDAEKYADYVTATDSVKVDVAASMVEAKQVDLDSVEVTFDTAMDAEAVETGLEVFAIVGTTKVEQLIKEVSFDETGKVATVDLYLEFGKGTTYVVEYADMEPVQFTATTTDFADVVRMEINESTVTAGQEKELSVSLYNAEGVNITEGTDSVYGTPLEDRVTFDETSSNETYLDNGFLLIFEVGTTTTVTATYHTLNYDNNGKELGNIVVQKVIKGVDEAAIGSGSIKAYTIVADDATLVKDVDWDEIKHQITVGNNDSRLVLKLEDPADEDKFVYSDEFDFDFTSSNDSVLIVDNEGRLYPVKEGAAVVVVKLDNTVIGALNITVAPESKAAFMTLDEYRVKLSNYAAAHDYKDVKVTVNDQYSEELAVDGLVASFKSGAGDAITAIEYGEGTKDAYVRFSAEGVDKGTYVYVIKANDIERTVTIVVGEPVADDKTLDDYNVKYEIVADTKYDIAVDEDTDLDAGIQVKVLGFVDGFVVTENLLDDIEYTLEVADPKDDGVTVTSTGAIKLHSVSGGAISKDEIGTYKLVAKQKQETRWVAIDSSYFVVEDTQTKPSLTIETLVYEEGEDILTAADNCFSAKIDGVKLILDDVDYVGSATTNNKYVKSITVKEMISNGNYILHEVTVNKNITVK